MGIAHQSHYSRVFSSTSWLSSTGSQRKVCWSPIRYSKRTAWLSQDAEERIFLGGISMLSRWDANRWMIVENGCLSLGAFGMGGWGVELTNGIHPWRKSEKKLRKLKLSAGNTNLSCWKLKKNWPTSTLMELEGAGTGTFSFLFQLVANLSSLCHLRTCKCNWKRGCRLVYLFIHKDIVHMHGLTKLVKDTLDGKLL